MSTEMIQTVSAVWPFAVLGLIFYFMLYRPNKQEQEKRKTLLDSLKVGDKVITIGGIYGTITKIDDERVTLKIAENVEVGFWKFAINTIQDNVKKA